MICPKCGFNKINILHSKITGPVVRRVRECPKCHFIVKTIEQPIFELNSKEREEYEAYIANEIGEEINQKQK